MDVHSQPKLRSDTLRIGGDGRVHRTDPFGATGAIKRRGSGIGINLQTDRTALTREDGGLREKASAEPFPHRSRKNPEMLKRPAFGASNHYEETHDCPVLLGD